MIRLHTADCHAPHALLATAGPMTPIPTFVAMTPDQLRASYLEFFQQRAHRVVASSPVIPEGDKTLLFTNAGMNQFKDVLLGLETRDYQRAASVQKCVRAGGKHNDLDEVGKSPRHLTFFEMLGNWSFGEYYKREAIAWAWEYITRVVQLDPERLFVSVFRTDDESHAIWRDEVGVPDAHIVRLDEDDNFWSMGPTGPCGPCTEIYYDVYPERGDAVWQPGFEDDRFIEIWNLVFMESDAQADGTLVPLPMQSVDTGMGLDRVAAILAGVNSVFKTELFAPTLSRIHELLTGEAVEAPSLFDHPQFTSYCVIADHIRTVLFSIVDGARFANDGRGYVLRRILRRAVRHGRQLGFDAPFLCEVTDAVVANFQHVYPELRLKHREAATVIRTEEERFFRTIDRGTSLFEEVVTEAKAAGSTTIDGDAVFKLYDTFGFPPDLTEIMAEEHGMTIDTAGYTAAMERQRSRSRAADERYEDAGEWQILADGNANTFVGYATLEVTTDVLRFRPLDEGRVEFTLRESPFYAESGGQVGDTGTVESEDGALVIDVEDVQKTPAGITLTGTVSDGNLTAERLSRPVHARVNPDTRQRSASNHTATHLLHAALHRTVSKDAFQAGSLVAPNRLRFDFSHGQAVTDEQLAEMEAWVNAEIQADRPVTIHDDVPLAEAERRGAMMMFGEKYGETVRMVEVGADSLELCGGTHVGRTGELAYFRIVAESGVAAGVRRIEAVTREEAFALAQADRKQVETLAELLKSPVAQLEERVQKLLTEHRALERQVESLTQQAANQQAAQLASSRVDIEGVGVLASRVDVPNRDALLAMADGLRDQLGTVAVALLAAVLDGKPALLVMATDAAVKQHGLKAGDLINDAAHHVGGRGGGRPTLAQAGGKDVGGIDAALAGFADAVRGRLA